MHHEALDTVYMRNITQGTISTLFLFHFPLGKHPLQHKYRATTQHSHAGRFGNVVLQSLKHKNNNDDRTTAPEANAEHCPLKHAWSGRSSPYPLNTTLFCSHFSLSTPKTHSSFLTFRGSPVPAGKLAAFCSGTCCQRQLQACVSSEFLF